MTPPKLAVHTISADSSSEWFARWSGCLVDSLVLAQESKAISGWRIVLGSAGGQAGKTLDVPDQLAHRVTAARGAAAHVALGADMEFPQQQRVLSATGDEDLVLILDSATLIPPMSLSRMLFSWSSGLSEVRARRLPIERDDDDALAVADVGACTLLERAALADVLALNRATEPAAVVVCSNAIVFADVRLDSQIHGSDTGDDSTLLELATDVAGLAEAKRTIKNELGCSQSPLLSIVMRTQLRRPEALRDVLLCLAGQSDGRFELLLVAHDADEGAVRDELNQQPRWLVSRTRVVRAEGGTRSRPLNVGISEAMGTHVAFLDDDDLVFAHWVEAFLAAAQVRGHQLLRATAGAQKIGTVPWPREVQGHHSDPEIDLAYPGRFNLPDHLRTNKTPFMALGFPRSFFTLFGGADEELEVCEDWDLVLRAASVLGVADLPSITAIYRRWSSGNDSYSVHSSGVWARDMDAVRRKLDAGTIILPVGSASELVALTALRGKDVELAAVLKSTSWRVTAPLRSLMVGASMVRQVVTAQLARFTRHP